MRELRRKEKIFKKIINEIEEKMNPLKKRKKKRTNKELKKISFKILKAFDFSINEMLCRTYIHCDLEDFSVFHDITKEIKKLKKIRKEFISILGKNEIFSQKLKKKNFPMIF